MRVSQRACARRCRRKYDCVDRWRADDYEFVAGRGSAAANIDRSDRECANCQRDVITAVYALTCRLVTALNCRVGPPSTVAVNALAPVPPW